MHLLLVLQQLWIPVNHQLALILLDQQLPAHPQLQQQQALKLQEQEMPEH
jgi:hypothetical protein